MKNQQTKYIITNWSKDIHFKIPFTKYYLSFGIFTKYRG